MQLATESRLHCPVRKKERKKKRYLRIPYRRSELQDIKLDQILHREDVQSLHPLPEVAAQTRISYKLNIPVGVQLSNYVELSRLPELRADSQPYVPLSATCPCQRWKSSGSLSDDGHVVTTDPAVLKNKLLRALWTKGRKYRCQYHLAGVYPAIVEGLNEYIANCHSANADFSAWKDSFLSTVRARISQSLPTAEQREVAKNLGRFNGIWWPPMLMNRLTT